MSQKIQIIMTDDSDINKIVLVNEVSINVFRDLMLKDVKFVDDIIAAMSDEIERTKQSSSSSTNNDNEIYADYFP